MLTFTVYGVAQPKGSMKAYVPRGMKFPIVTDSNRNLRSWSQLVAQGASDALLQRDGPQLIGGPVRVKCAFFMPRPKKHHRRGVPLAHQTAPDIDKLLRSVLDALTKVVWHDDSQVVELFGMKRYADVDEAPHVCISVEETPGAWPVELPAVPMPLFG